MAKLGANYIVNETKAFRIIEKSEKQFIHVVEEGFWVHNGVFGFFTNDKARLQRLGLLDFAGHAADNGCTGQISDMLATAELKRGEPVSLPTRFVYMGARIFASEDTITAIKEPYAAVFGTKAVFIAWGPCLYAYTDDGKCLGFTLGIRMPTLRDELTAMIGVLDK